MDGWVFERPDTKRFPALALAYKAAARGGTAPAVMNAANEVAVHAFLAGRIRFTDIVKVAGALLSGWRPSRRAPGLSDVLRADREARMEAARMISRKRRPNLP
jgi:1-deoxy-D-xylulose-5-phosphate reductoisomerase